MPRARERRDTIATAASGDWSARRAAGWVAGVTVVAAAYHLLGQSQRTRWADEAATYWTIQAHAADLIRSARTDGSPPLYFLHVQAATRAFGASELALRLVSLIAATALVPAIYGVTRVCASRRAGVMAAALAAISPLVHYYSVEARAYALLQLETLLIVYATARAIGSPARLRYWALLAVAHAIQLSTHGYAVFLLPVPVIVCLLAGGRARLVLAVKAAAAAGLAYLVCLPWLLGAVDVTGAGVADWIRPVWDATPPPLAIVRSLEVFGFGGRYPSHLWLSQAPAVRLLSLPLGLGLLVVAAIPWAERATDGNRTARYSLLSFLFVPLLGSWLYSLVRQPLYLVGRYDAIVLPVFLILIALGLDKMARMHRWLAVAAMSAVVLLAAVSGSVALGPPLVLDPENLGAAQYLVTAAAPGDPIVVLGIRLSVVMYYFDRAGYRANFVLFPSEIGDHPGWYSVTRLLGDRPRLEREAQQLTEDLARAAEAGHPIWVLPSPSNAVDEYLYRSLSTRTAIDPVRSRQDQRVLCLKAR